jgi:hypothetical protein
MEILIKQMEEENERLEREKMRQLVKAKQDELEETLIRFTRKKGEKEYDL